MMQAQSKSPLAGWGALIRLVRGGFHDDVDVQRAMLARRRRDRHPDAPPRAPLFASRDLPPPEADTPAGAHEDAATGAVITPLVEVATRLEVVPQVAPPRAPEPFSDEELAEAVAGLPPRRVTLPVRARTVDLLDDIDLPLIPGANIIDLAARFEQGLAKRQVVIHAEEAQHALAERLPLAQGDPVVRAALRAQPPVEVVSMPQPVRVDPVERPAADTALRVDAEVETALNQALATLRKLTEQGRR
jgi:hypothetical protein